MLCGVFICTYSAIFISTPMLIYLGAVAARPEVAKAVAAAKVAPAE